MKDIHQSRLKDEIIFQILEYIDNKNEINKNEAIQKLSELAKFYQIPFRKSFTNIKLNQALKDFVINSKGYTSTIPNLYKTLSIE